jgi:hypothetical protein
MTRANHHTGKTTAFNIRAHLQTPNKPHARFTGNT